MSTQDMREGEKKKKKDAQAKSEDMNIPTARCAYLREILNIKEFITLVLKISWSTRGDRWVVFVTLNLRNLYPPFSHCLIFFYFLFLLCIRRNIIISYSLFFPNRRDSILRTYVSCTFIVRWFRIVIFSNSSNFLYYFQFLISPSLLVTDAAVSYTYNLCDEYPNFILLEWQKVRVGSAV